jgi:hypothetical protein
VEGIIMERTGMTTMLAEFSIVPPGAGSHLSDRAAKVLDQKIASGERRLQRPLNKQIRTTVIRKG